MSSSSSNLKEKGISSEFTVLGQLKGALADEITSKAGETRSLVKDTQGTPIIIAGEYVASLNEQETEAIKKAFNSGTPLALLNVERNQIRQFTNLLGPDVPDSVGDDFTYLEAYAVHKDKDRVVWQSTFYPPVNPTEVETYQQTIHRFDDGTQRESSVRVDTASQPTGKNKEATMVLDSPESVAQRAGQVLQWLTVDASGKTRSQSVMEEYGEAQSARIRELKSEAQNNLVQLASAFVHEANYPWGWTMGTANFQVTSFAYSCYVQDTRESWFYIEQMAVLNPSVLYDTKSDREQSLYVDSYELEAKPGGYENNSSAVTMIHSSPGTTTGQRSVTSGITWNIGGSVNVGADATNGPNASIGIQGGISISNSTTFDIPDVKINNKSNDNGNNPHWVYEIPRVYGVEDGCVNSISNAVNISHNTFQPVNHWLWKVNDSVRRNNSRLKVRNTLKVRAIQSWITNNCNFFGCNCDVAHNEYLHTKNFDFYLPFPVPYYVEIVAKHSGKALDVDNASSARGANVQQWERNYSQAQQWRLQDAGDGYFYIINKTGKALEVEGGSTENSANVRQWDLNNTNAQKWKFEDAGEGYTYIVNKNSEKVLDVRESGTGNGVNVLQYQRTGNDNQKWRVQ
ncbi:RICIN domain-containing protein [Microcoleus sp. AR_TQ3_B6]|uniref:RICIN domain-containing protein n=1 Tax=Microcoleus sp. AR_TQ3_B6 TaxID=3055284 RepID=UPI002FD3B4E8